MTGRVSDRTFGPAGFSSEATGNDANKAPVHALAHDVGQDRAGRADQSTSDDEGGVFQRKADSSSRPPGIGIEHRDHHRHVGAADRNDERDPKQGKTSL